jgi:hypothetical protein
VVKILDMELELVKQRRSFIPDGVIIGFLG